MKYELGTTIYFTIDNFIYFIKLSTISWTFWSWGSIITKIHLRDAAFNILDTASFFNKIALIDYPNTISYKLFIPNIV